MSIIYVPPNKNSFWQQIYNGTGLYGLAMSQLVRGLMNGVNKRHEAYIDKRVQDRQAAQLDAAWQHMKNNRGTHNEITSTPIQPEQYSPQDKLESIALSPSDYRNSLNPNVFEQNKQRAALQNSLNQPMQNFVDNAWNNVEGRGINIQTVQNPLDHSLFMDAVTSAKLSPKMMSDLYKVMQKEIENNADLASRQRTAQAVQGMAEPTDIRGLVAMDALSGKGTAVNAYNAINPGYSVNSFNNGDVQGIAKTDKRTGETTFDYGQPYGISATKLLEDSTKKYIAQLKESGAWGRHYTPTGTAIFNAKNGNNKPITDAGYNSARKYGMDLVNQLGSNDAIADQMLRQTQDPRRLQAMVDGAYGAEKIAEYGLGMKDNPMHGKAPARLMRAIDPNYLNQQQAKEVAYYRKNYPKETANMTDVDIAKQFNFYNPRGGEKGYVWH